MFQFSVAFLRFIRQQIDPKDMQELEKKFVDEVATRMFEFDTNGVPKVNLEMDLPGEHPLSPHQQQVRRGRTESCLGKN